MNNTSFYKSLTGNIAEPIWLVCSFLFFLFFLSTSAFAQKAYFIDGYHGGVYGHYPEWQTQFMVDQLAQNPHWKINLEIEPETWDSVKISDPEAYQNWKNALTDPFFADRIEFVNPASGQPYFYNISGESVIRQLEYGIKKTNEHFPSVTFSTYSSEEPCFTSALPQILKSFGFKYASLKNPNTCWGGYTRAHNGELINWIGPDGTALKTVPRYAVEELSSESTWQTIAWDNSAKYLHACWKSGMKHPVGMCLQDAAWDNGPWLGKKEGTEYTTWVNYFENVAVEEPTENWKFSQEDVLVSLMWGAQVMQRLAQQIRKAENKVVMAEKLAAFSSRYRPFEWPEAGFEEAWRTLSLAQHHDCWIVPYNGRKNDTWVDKVVRWTGTTNDISHSVIQRAFRNLSAAKTASSGEKYIGIFNSLGTPRTEQVAMALPDNWTAANAEVLNERGEKVPVQVVSNLENGVKELLFLVEVPSLGHTTYRLKEGKSYRSKGAKITKKKGYYILETDFYKMTIEPEKGGRIVSLIAKKLDHKEFVDNSNELSFNEIRGFFYEKDEFFSNVDQKSDVSVLENGPLRVRLKIEGKIDEHPYTQVITLRQGDKKIDFDLTIDWKGNPGIGKYSQADNYRAEDPEKAFYNDKYKLLALFPLNLESQKLYKNAPFDVTESKLENTFYDRWDSIKHNVILNWVDVIDGEAERGFALFTDHTTSYAHGKDHPLALNLQYSGKGLWGRDYKIAGPSAIRYAIAMHDGTWNEAGLWTESVKWNEPLMTTMMDASPVMQTKSLLEIPEGGLEVTTMKHDEQDLMIRFFNAEAVGEMQKVVFDGQIQKAELIELNGKIAGELKVSSEGENKSAVVLPIPQFGIRTLRINFNN